MPLVYPAPQATLEPAAVQLILGQRTERLLTVTLAYSAQQHKVVPNVPNVSNVINVWVPGVADTLLQAGDLRWFPTHKASGCGGGHWVAERPVWTTAEPPAFGIGSNRPAVIGCCSTQVAIPYKLHV
jgi:hypothetical protein